MRRSHDATVEGGPPEATGEAEYLEICLAHGFLTTLSRRLPYNLTPCRKLRALRVDRRKVRRRHQARILGAPARILATATRAAGLDLLLGPQAGTRIGSRLLAQA